MVDIKSFFNDVSNNKFKTRDGKKFFHDEKIITQDKRFEKVNMFIKEKYNDDGQGIKSIIRDFDLPITYPVLRLYMINFFNIILRNNNEVTDFLRKRRSEKALYEKDNKIGFFSDGIQKSIKIKSTNTRGVQGYYFNKSLEKYVWLRSSWEYIYAKWLDTNNYKWDVEVMSFNMGDYTYRPDFFIYDNNNNITKIVEVKGYWKDKLYKFNELKEKLNIDVVLVDKIKPYTNISVKKELSIWKKIKKLNINIL